MKFENFHHGAKQFQPESGTDPEFGSASDEELDEGDLVRIAGEHRKKRGRGCLVSTLIESVHNDEGRDLCRPERTYEKFPQL